MSTTTFIKKCQQCKELKQFDDFYNNKSQRDSKDFYCKVCRRAQQDKYLDQKRFKKLCLRVYDKYQEYKKLNVEFEPHHLKHYKECHRKHLQKVWEYLFPSATMAWIEPKWIYKNV